MAREQARMRSRVAEFLAAVVAIAGVVMIVSALGGELETQLVAEVSGICGGLLSHLLVGSRYGTVAPSVEMAAMADFLFLLLATVSVPIAAPHNAWAVPCFLWVTICGLAYCLLHMVGPEGQDVSRRLVGVVWVAGALGCLGALAVLPLHIHPSQPLIPWMTAITLVTYGTLTIRRALRWLV